MGSSEFYVPGPLGDGTFAFPGSSSAPPPLHSVPVLACRSLTWGAGAPASRTSRALVQPPAHGSAILFPTVKNWRNSLLHTVLMFLCLGSSAPLGGDPGGVSVGITHRNTILLLIRSQPLVSLLHRHLFWGR